MARTLDTPHAPLALGLTLALGLSLAHGAARADDGKGAAPSGATATAAPAAASPRARAEQAIERGLRWLVKQQNANGSFGRFPGSKEEGEAGMTGLALRALAKAPERLAPEVKDAAAKAAAYLVKLQDASGAISNPRGGITVYRTSIAVSALVAHDAKAHADVVAKARAFLEGAQWYEGNGLPSDPTEAKKSPYYGGWGYDKASGRPRADLSNAAFVLDALADAGLPKDSETWKRAATFLARCQNQSETNDLAKAGMRVGDDGGFMYDPGAQGSLGDAPEGGNPSYASITYAGLMSMLHARLAKEDARVKGAMRWISSNYTLDENRGLGSRSGAGGKQGLFYYYNTFSKALAAWGEVEVGTEAGKRRWADDLARRLAELQAEDGSWVNENPRWWENDPVLCTSFSVLAAETALPWTSGEAPKKPEGTLR